VPCVLLLCLAASRPAGAAQAAPPAAQDPPASTATPLSQALADLAHGRHEAARGQLVTLAAADPSGEAALELGLFELYVGRLEEGRARLTAVLEGSGRPSPGRLLRAARAARGLGEFRDANALFRQAAASTPDDPAVNTAWGDLFLEKHNRADAIRSYRTALRADGNWAPAHVGIARAMLDDNPPAAREAAERAIAIDPDLVPAHLLLAELALDDTRHDLARAALQRALEVNPSSIEAHALMAAIAYVEDRPADFEAGAARVRAINGRTGEAYRAAGDLAARNYRFSEAVALTRKALEIDPEDVRAQAALGMHLLRTGAEDEAREVLSRAFRADPYDVVTYNLLGLFDALDSFETIQEGNLILRLHPDEALVLGEYALPLARSALETLSARYEMQVEGPVLVEIFPRHDDFAVRNLGLPGLIGALGACFGRVVTMDSPRAREPGAFNWGATLWHEMAHVITLQMSKQRVPRWLTEGISVYEEKRARPEWGHDMEVPFVAALNSGEVLKLADLNAGFQRPDTIALAYFQASLLVEHIVDTYGEAALRALLRAYGEGLDTDAALRRAAGVDMAALQPSFDAAIEKRFGALRRAMQAPEGFDPSAALATLKAHATTSPHSYAVQLALGLSLRAAGDADGAIAALETAAAQVPLATGPTGARAQLIDLLVERGDKARAVRELATLLSHDHTDLEAARRMAQLATEIGDEAAAERAFERVVALDPFDASGHTALGRGALKRGEATAAVREFRVVLAIGAADQAVAHTDLGEAYLAAGQPGEAKKQAIQALEIAPTFERAQELLLKSIETNP
jgi:tetratricopeptide (TPR) repeat protein